MRDGSLTSSRQAVDGRFVFPCWSAGSSRGGIAGRETHSLAAKAPNVTGATFAELEVYAAPCPGTMPGSRLAASACRDTRTQGGELARIESASSAYAAALSRRVDAGDPRTRATPTGYGRRREARRSRGRTDR